MFDRQAISLTLVLIGTLVCTLDALAIDTGAISSFRGPLVSSGEDNTVAKSAEDEREKKILPGSYAQDDKEEERDDDELNDGHIVEAKTPPQTTLSRKPILPDDDDSEEEAGDDQKKTLGSYDGHHFDNEEKMNADNEKPDDGDDEINDGQLVETKLPSHNELSRKPILIDDEKADDGNDENTRTDAYDGFDSSDEDKINEGDKDNEEDDDDDDDESAEQLVGTKIAPQVILVTRPILIPLQIEIKYLTNLARRLNK